MPAQDQRSAAVVLPAPDVDAAEGADLADGLASVLEQPAEFVLVADREADTRQGRTHRITFRCASSPAEPGLWPT